MFLTPCPSCSKPTLSLRYRFPAPSPGSNSGKRVAIIREIERQASEAWRSTLCEVPVDFGTEAASMTVGADEHKCKAVAAYDFMTVQISAADNNDTSYPSRGGGTRSEVVSRQSSRSSPPKRRRGPHSGGAR